MNEAPSAAPLEGEPIQQGVEHGPHNTDSEVDRLYLDRYAANEAFADGHITKEANDKLVANVEQGFKDLYDKHGVEHGPHLPLTPDEEERAASKVENEYGYRPEEDQRELLQASHQLRQHHYAVEKAYNEEPGITHDEREERHDGIYDAEQAIYDAHDANSVNSDYYDRYEEDDFSDAARIARERLDLDDEDESDEPDEEDDEDDDWDDDEDDGSDGYDATPADAAVDFQVDTDKGEADTRSDAEIEREDDVVTRLHMSGSDDPEAHWDEYDQLHGTVNGGEKPELSKK